MGYPEAQYVIEELSREFEEVAPQFGPEPKPVVVTNAVNNKKNTIDLTVTMPGDVIINGYTLVKLAGVKVVYKKDSIPENPNDGTLFKDITSPLTGSTHVVVTGLENLASYGIRFFPYSDKGTYSTDPSNGAMYTVEYENYVAFTQNFNDSNIDTCISYLGQNKDWSPVRVDSSQNVNLNQWAEWDWLKKIKYALIDKNGHIVEDLNINDWTKKTDGSPSMLSNGNLETPFRNMDNSSNTGNNIGLYVWFPNLYMKEVYSGSQRTVYFSTTKDGKTMADANLVIGHVYDQDYKGLWVPMFPNTSSSGNASKYPCSYLSSLSSRYDMFLRNKSIRSGVTETENQTKSVMSNWVFNGAPFALVLRDILIMLSKSSHASRSNYQMIQSSYGRVNKSDRFYKGGIFPSISNSTHSSIATAPFGLFSMFLYGNQDSGSSGDLLIDLYQYFTQGKDHLYRTVLQKNIASILTDKSEPVVSTHFGSAPNRGTGLDYSKQTRLVKGGCPSPIDPEVWVQDGGYKYLGGYVAAGTGFLYMTTSNNDGMVEHDFYSERNVDTPYSSGTHIGIGGGIIVLPTDPNYDPNEV